MSTNAMRVVPTRTEGLPEVTEVIFYHDRVTICSAGQWVVILFAPLARWPRPAWLRKVLAWFGYRPIEPLIADRKWVATETESLFEFYTTPPFKLWLLFDDNYGASPYVQLQQFLRQGGYETGDMS